LGGNHVIIGLRTGELVALCHLQHGSIRVSVGQSVAVGDEMGRCGNSGNSTEPHVHVQAVDSIDLRHATAIPINFQGRLPRNREVVDIP
jgi:murein DD-endopeptidase MepM/ murein hydrolase activator NlpD